MREQFGNVGFRIRKTDGDGLHPGWEPSIVVVKRPIPGSRDVVRQIIGTGSATIELRIRFDSLASYLAMQAMLGATDTLVLRSRFTNARGTTLYEDGETWEYLPDTTLESLTKPKYELSGRVEAFATFERPLNPATGRADL